MSDTASELATNVTSPAVRDAIARAADLRLVGLLFARPTAARRRAVEALAAEAAGPELRALAARLASIDEPTYVSLLGPGGPVSPREAAYIGRQDPGRVMAELAAFYEAFAYRARTEDPSDHVAVETDFAAYLSLKEAYAVARGDSETARMTADACQRFLSTHLSVLAAGMTRRLGAVTAPDLLALAQALLERTGAPPPPAGAADAPEDADDLSCGLCGDAGGPPASAGETENH